MNVAVVVAIGDVYVEQLLTVDASKISTVTFLLFDDPTTKLVSMLLDVFKATISKLKLVFAIFVYKCY